MAVHTAGGRLAIGPVEVRHGYWNLPNAFGIGDISDVGLERLRRGFQRELEDIADGLDTDDPRKVAGLKAELDEVEKETALREALRYCGARENGTHSYADYVAGGGMKIGEAEDGSKAIVCDAPPSYPLAFMLDYRRYRDGGAYVLNWPHIEGALGGRERVTQALAGAWLGGIA